MHYPKAVQERANRACSCFAERSLHYPKAVQAKNKRGRSRLALCGFTYPKNIQDDGKDVDSDERINKIN